MEQYRRSKPARALTKLVIVQMVANEYALGDIKNPLDFQVVGFDTAAPKLIADFLAH